MAAKGTIKKIVSDRGFGFISQGGGAGDIFFHCSAVEGTQFDRLVEGQPVTFETEQGRKGMQAAHVRAA